MAKEAKETKPAEKKLAASLTNLTENDLTILKEALKVEAITVANEMNQVVSKNDQVGEVMGYYTAKLIGITGLTSRVEKAASLLAE